MLACQTMDPTDLMRLAIEKCRQGIAAGQSPFGCAIARDGEGHLLLAQHGRADDRHHGPRRGERHSRGVPRDRQHLPRRRIVATTCEPCPMCMSALHWARVDTVYYGATIADADSAGFNELQLPAAELLRIGGSKLKLVPQCCRKNARQLFAEWKE